MIDLVDPVVVRKVTFGRHPTHTTMCLPLEKTLEEATETAKKILAWAARHDTLDVEFDAKTGKYRVHITHFFPVVERVEPLDA